MVFIVALLITRYSTLFDRPHRVPPPGPTGESLVTQLVEGLSAAAERETNPERKTQVQQAADLLGSTVRDVVADVAAKVVGPG